MLEGKWNFVSYIKNHHRSGNDNIITTTASSGDYVNFFRDGKLLLRLLSFEDNSTYTVLSNNKILFYGDTFDIKTIDATQFTLIKRDVVSTIEYYEETYNFQK
jgi:hypothetical protein